MDLLITELGCYLVLHSTLWRIDIVKRKQDMSYVTSILYIYIRIFNLLKFKIHSDN